MTHPGVLVISRVRSSKGVDAGARADVCFARPAQDHAWEMLGGRLSAQMWWSMERHIWYGVADRVMKGVRDG